MSTQGRHRAPQARKVRLSKVPAFALATTLVLTGAVAVTSHGSSASSQIRSSSKPLAEQPATQSGVTTQTSKSAQSVVDSKAAKRAKAKAIARAKAQSKAAAKARARIKAVAKAKAKALAKAKAVAKAKAKARAKASVNKYVSARSKAKSTAATRSRAISSLRGQVASLKSQIRKPALIGKKVIDVADNYRGVPYVRGGTSPRGFDCSGYTQYVYSKLGIALPRVADAQARSAVPVRRIFAKPGDLVFYRSGSGYVYHVGIYAGGGKIWHSPVPGKVVEKVRISSRNVTFGRVSKSATQNALAIKLAKKTARLANLIHNK